MTQVIASTPGRPSRPLLREGDVTLAAPSQVWTRGDGATRDDLDGVFHGDVRHLTGLRLTVGSIDGVAGRTDPTEPEWIAASRQNAGEEVFVGVLGRLPGLDAGNGLRLLRRRTLTPGRLEEAVILQSALARTVELTLHLEVCLDFTPFAILRSASAQDRALSVNHSGATVDAACGAAACHLDFSGARVDLEGATVRAAWRTTIAAHGTTTISWSADLADDSLVVAAPTSTWPPAPRGPVAPGTPDQDALQCWLDTAWDDLGALRLTLAGRDGEFIAAGAPWYFTLFGRDALWAARLLLPEALELAEGTLSALASLQGTKVDAVAQETPGKILHELRSADLDLGGGHVLPPVYYGSVDSTPLWICTLADARDAGLSDQHLLSHAGALVNALTWLTTMGDADGDGFLDYFDEAGRGLANQGWKDSDDSIQWRDGRLAQGPLALCEVQGYAYEAAMAGANLLEQIGSLSGGIGSGTFSLDEADPVVRIPDPAGLRQWAVDLKDRFARRFWVTTEEGTYPAVALDGRGRAVDTLTSNIGHLIGTGILSAGQERALADLLMGPSMSSGYGLRTVSTGAAGYWPQSYHMGSVWTHDTAIAIRGMWRGGLVEQARALARGLVRAAAAFDGRVPELHSGDPASDFRRPVPYPSACRPQAWSAASALVCARVLGRPH